jgi:hypothetical protein
VIEAGLPNRQVCKIGNRPAAREGGRKSLPGFPRALIFMMTRRQAKSKKIFVTNEIVTGVPGAE